MARFNITNTEAYGLDWHGIVEVIEDFCTLASDPDGDALAIFAHLQRNGIVYAVATPDKFTGHDTVEVVPSCVETTAARDKAVANRVNVYTLAVYGTGEDGEASAHISGVYHK